MEQHYALHNMEDMKPLAESVQNQLKSGDVVLLYGELGSGKTTFTQYLAQLLGITTQLTSPTFTITAEYAIPGHKDLKKLVHADLYRLSEQAAAHDPAVQDVLEHAQEPGVITIIEWADRIPALALAKVGRLWKLHFSHGAQQNERTVTIEEVSYAA